MIFEDLINIERLEISEDIDSYIVKYRGEVYHIAKERESSFLYPHPKSMEMSQRQLLLHRPGLQILQDDLTHDEFKEVMIFHELREHEYCVAGFQDAHNRAVNDEILYALKFFDPKKQKRYFKFSRRYRIGEEPITSARLLLPNMDAEEAYDAGKELPDEIFGQIGDSIVEILSTDATWSLRALSDWTDPRMEQYASKLFEAASQDPQNIADLGITIPDQRFRKFSDYILNAALTSPELAYRALDYWVYWRAEEFADRLIPKMIEDPNNSLKTLLHPRRESPKPNPHIDVLMDSILHSPMASLRLGLIKPAIARRTLFARKLAESVAKDPELLERARKEWPKSLSRYLSN